MATVPLWLLGKHLTSVVLTGQDVSSSGVLSDSGDSATLTATISSLNLQLTPQTEEINALNTTRENEVILADGATLDIEALLVNNGSDPSPLRTLVFGYDYFKAVWVEGTGGSQQTITFLGHRGQYSDGFRGRGASIAQFQLGPIDPGQAQVVIA